MRLQIAVRRGQRHATMVTATPASCSARTRVAEQHEVEQHHEDVDRHLVDGVVDARGKVRRDIDQHVEGRVADDAVEQNRATHLARTTGQSRRSGSMAKAGAAGARRPSATPSAHKDRCCRPRPCRRPLARPRTGCRGRAACRAGASAGPPATVWSFEHGQALEAPPPAPYQQFGLASNHPFEGLQRTAVALTVSRP